MVVVHQQELLKQFLECKALALHFFIFWSVDNLKYFI